MPEILDFLELSLLSLIETKTESPASFRRTSKKSFFMLS